MNFETIKLTQDARGIATLTLARPEKHNALNALMIAEITKASAHLGADETVRAVVLAAKGASFCAGGDLSWMQAQMQADRAGKVREATKLSTMLNALNTLPKPLIARVEGNAYGGGIGLMAVCDIVIAKPRLKFALTETRLGLIPATIGPFVRERLGAANARQVFFTGRSFSVKSARRMGLVARIASDMDKAVEDELHPILKTQPHAVAAAKALLRALGDLSTAEQIPHSIAALADCWESDEAQTQIRAFLKGRT